MNIKTILLLTLITPAVFARPISDFNAEQISYISSSRGKVSVFAKDVSERDFACDWAVDHGRVITVYDQDIRPEKCGRRQIAARG